MAEKEPSAWSSDASSQDAGSKFSSGGASGQPPNTPDVVLIMGMINDEVKKSEDKQIAKIEGIEGKIDAKLSRMASTKQLLGATSAVIAAVFTGVATLIAVFALGGDRFDGGLGIGASIGDKFAENKIEIERLRLNENEVNRQILDELKAIRLRVDKDAQSK